MAELQADFSLEQQNIQADFNVQQSNLDAIFRIDVAGANAVWGSITGNIANQIDLKDELDTLSGQIDSNHSEITNIATTMQGYGNIVTHDANDFATATQGALADTALQPNDNISELNNNAGYITGITSADVTTALGYTPYNSSNPNGYQANVIESIKVNGTAQTITNKAVDITVPSEVNETTVSGWGFTKNIGTVTSVNNTSPDSSGNVTLSIPAAQVNSDWNATSGVAEILNKPTIPTVDQTYSSTSANAQSGVAINGELTSNYQPKLVSQSNIKAINNTSLLGSGSLSLVDIASAQTVSGTKTFYSLSVNNPATSSSSIITLTNNGKTAYFGITYEGKTVIITPGVDKKFYYRDANDWLLAKSMLDTGLSYNTTTDKISVTFPTVDQTYNSSSANAQSGVAIAGELANYQAALVSGTNIKTINNESILGSGNISISGGGSTWTYDSNTENLTIS